jgi:hypothetical protein
MEAEGRRSLNKEHTQQIDTTRLHLIYTPTHSPAASKEPYYFCLLASYIASAAFSPQKATFPPPKKKEIHNVVKLPPPKQLPTSQ